MNKETHNDEIDLAHIFLNLWDNKIKIIIITTIFFILGFLFHFYSSNKNYIAATNIKPISLFESQKYELYNNVAKEILNNNFQDENLINKETGEIVTKETRKILTKETVNEINKKSLLNLFISKIQTEEMVEKAIIKLKLIDKDNFKNEEDYREAIKTTAISIIDKIQPPQINKEGKSNKKAFWSFNYEIENKTIWKNFLEYLEKQANEEIRQSLINQFDTAIEILNFNSKFELEDIDQKIKNAMDDYKVLISYRLAFLEEQAEIARKLNISKNTLEVENFLIENNIVTNIKSEDSYYLKGYEMIEKEISLIKSRKEVDLFNQDLIELKKTKRNILQNNKTDRLRLLFSEIPVNSKDDFIAAKINYVATKYETQSSLSKILVISIIAGLLFSFIYIFFNNLITSRK